MVTPDVFNNDVRFIFSNWTKEDFNGKWENNVTTIKAGETKELPMYLAYNFCKHLVDREMNRDNKASVMGIEEQRKPYEEKTIAEITAGTDSPAMSTLKDKIRAEMESEKITPASKDEMSSGDVNVKVEGEFADLEENKEILTPKKSKK